MATQRKWRRKELQKELVRRSAFPSCSDSIERTVRQSVSLTDLYIELVHTADSDSQRLWREYEYALAAEHYRLWPERPFVRSVNVVVQ